MMSSLLLPLGARLLKYSIFNEVTQYFQMSSPTVKKQTVFIYTMIHIQGPI